MPGSAEPNAVPLLRLLVFPAFLIFLELMRAALTLGHHFYHFTPLLWVFQAVSVWAFL